MIDTKKEALEYYEHNPQDKEPIFFVLVTAEQKRDIDEYLCVLEYEENPFVCGKCGQDVKDE
tara:strand:- start:159 stop:344 length:186 start_codon:yes stop_codon:yes gene_type:complete